MYGGKNVGNKETLHPLPSFIKYKKIVVVFMKLCEVVLSSYLLNITKYSVIVNNFDLLFFNSHFMTHLIVVLRT